MRFAVFAQEAVKVLHDARAIEALPSNGPGLSARDLSDRLSAKSAAKQDIATFSEMLFPPDEPVN